MNVNLLIDAIVRQTMILIAQLATSAGIRAPLAHVANQVFLDLVNELTEQGVGRKVIADMFGIALRTYHSKVRRLSESATMKGRSLWEAIYEFIDDNSPVSRARVLQRFRNDDGPTVRSVLHDLVTSGLVTCTGRGDSTVYRMTPEDEIGHAHDEPQEAATAIVWVAVHRQRGVSRDELVELTRIDEDRLEAALAELEADGRVTSEKDDDGVFRYSADACVLPIGTEGGWEAALFDHYQALVTAICSKLRRGGTRAAWGDAIGGSTYTIDLWHGHPLEQDVLTQLREVREKVTDLRERVDAESKPSSLGPDADYRVIFYVGQTIIGDERDGSEHDHTTES